MLNNTAYIIIMIKCLFEIRVCYPQQVATFNIVLFIIDATMIAHFY